MQTGCRQKIFAGVFDFFCNAELQERSFAVILGNVYIYNYCIEP